MKQYSLYPSPSLLFITMFLYLLACFCLMVYFNNSGLALLAMLLIVLLLFAEIRNFAKARRQEPELISLSSSTNEIEWTSGADKQLFTQYSVYTNRWGMVLKLKSRRARYHLILLADRFRDEDEYLDFRYQLIHLKQVINAS